MQTLAHIREMLDQRGLAPKKSLGQNFLIDHNLIRKLVDASGVGEGDLVLEIGPGTGTLTDELLDRGCRVIACELDNGLCALLRDRFAGSERFTLIEGDCLAGKRALSPALYTALGDRTLTLVANLPYGAGTPLLLILLTRYPHCRGMHVTIQREVADRVMAGPGSESYGSISVIAQALADMTRVATLPPQCFWPRPKVDSAMISIHRKGTPLASDPVTLADLCQRVFTQRRKQIGTACRNLGLTLPPDIPPIRRVFELTPTELVKLSEAVDKV